LFISLLNFFLSNLKAFSFIISTPTFQDSSLSKLIEVLFLAFKAFPIFFISFSLLRPTFSDLRHLYCSLMFYPNFDNFHLAAERVVIDAVFLNGPSLSWSTSLES